MCLVDIPAIYETYDIIIDASINKQFKITEIQFKVLEEAGGRTGWVEILCEKDITYDKIKSLQQALNDRGYNIDIVDGILDSDTKAVLTKYQQDNDLPVGNLNIETLKYLGVL